MKVTERAPCPKCGVNLTGATGVNTDAHPREGDYTICAYCLSPLVFNADMSVRLPTDKELLEIHSMVSGLVNSGI